MRSIARYIEMTPGIAGGRPRIAGHRIRVMDIAVWHEWMGMTGDEMADQFGLTLAEIYAGLAYYFDNQEEIDAAIRADREFADQMEKDLKLRAALGG